MKAIPFSSRLLLRLAAVPLLGVAGLVGGCSDYTTYGDDVGNNVVYGDKYYGSGAYSSWGYAGSYYGGGYYGGGGAIIVTPPHSSAPRPTPH